MMQIVYTLKTLCLCVSVFILTGCTKADIHYPTIETVQGMVMIYPDQSKYTLPALKYHFYNVDTQIEYIVCSCDGSGNFEGMLPIGTYRVIATNTNAQYVEFTDMQSYELATVTALPVFTRSTAQPTVKQRSALANYQLLTVNYLAQPGEVYSTVMSELTVSQTDTLRYEPSPVLLTRRLRLLFTLQGELITEVSALNGVLRGVYPSMYLYTCSHTQEGISQAPDMAIGFDTEVQGNQREAQISLFGLCDPGYGHVYANELPLELTMNDGSKQQVTLDLTDVLSDIISQNQGTIPIEITIPIDIKRVGIGIEGIVTGWINEGETEIDK